VGAAHLFDVTALVGTEGTADEQKQRHQALEMAVRRVLYGQGYALPYDHENEDGEGSIPAWRDPSDQYRRARYNG
jgi:hypothetical protein